MNVVFLEFHDIFISQTISMCILVVVTGRFCFVFVSSASSNIFEYQVIFRITSQACDICCGDYVVQVLLIQLSIPSNVH